MDGRSITPARRLDAAPAGLRASSTRQTITARPIDRTDELDHAGHVRPAPRIEELNRAGGIEEPDDFHNRPPLETEIISPHWIDRSLTGLAGPDYDAIISFGLPIEPEDS